MQGSARAKELRSNLTDAERLLWHRLRSRRLAGFKFRRQVSIGPYVVDFVCWSAQLIVEADGGQHSTRTEYDRRRDAYLRRQGFSVLRFWNNEVLGNIEGVLEVVIRELRGRESPST